MQLVSLTSLLQIFLVGACLLSDAREFDVGTGKKFSDPNEVPWESLEPGDHINIFWRAKPYQSKWVICHRGTEEKPIVIRGVPEGEKLPVVDGSNATTRKELDYWGDQRSVIKIGGAQMPADTTPAYIRIENLEIRSARPPFFFTGRKGVTRYVSNAASINVEKGEHITIRGCILRDSGNGLFVSKQSKEILIEGCSIFDNGMEGSIYEHNVYTAAAGITFENNHFGPLRKDCGGNNIKDRSAGLVVRYNWIEGGNRQLDLVDAEDSAALRDDPRYRKTFIYGNVLIETDGSGNKQIVHYGGDSRKEAWYRKGTLYFYNNTVISRRRDNTLLFSLSTKDEKVDFQNNIVYLTANGRSLSQITAIGSIDLGNNWFKSGLVRSDKKTNVHEKGNLIIGSSPGFAEEAKDDFHLAHDSPCIKAAAPLENIPSEYIPSRQYVPHQSSKPRPTIRDLGALESGN